MFAKSEKFFANPFRNHCIAKPVKMDRSCRNWESHCSGAGKLAIEKD
jgi:hypothetical protein